MVEDVVTTGLSSRECIEAAQALGANVSPRRRWRTARRARRPCRSRCILISLTSRISARSTSCFLAGNACGQTRKPGLQAFSARTDLEGALRSWCFRPRLRGRLGDMLFKRKKRLSAAMRLRYAAWPARSFRRSFRYRLLRLLRIQASAHSIALGCALGVFAVFTPFLGFQMMIAAVLAMVLRGSVVASAVGSFAGNPLIIHNLDFDLYRRQRTSGQLGQRGMGKLSDGAEALGRSIREVSRWRRECGSGPVADPQAHGAGFAAFGGLGGGANLFSRPPACPCPRTRTRHRGCRYARGRAAPVRLHDKQ